MIRLALILLLIPIAAGAAEHEIQLLDDQGNQVRATYSAEATCGDCHDPEYIAPHGPHSVDTGADCLQCHLSGELPEPEDGWYALKLERPGSAACGTCHGLVVSDPDEPFFFPPDPARSMTYATGAIFAPGRIPRSGMNVAARDSLARPWDVHAERLVGCVDCHSATTDNAPSCVGCHETEGTHAFLPDAAAHFAKLTCEACHVPGQYGAALANVDHTLLDAAGEPLRRYHGAIGDPASPKTLVRGYRPVLLPRTDDDGITRLAPHNLVANWVWSDGGVEVDRAILEEAFLVYGEPHPAVLNALDATGDGEVSDLEYGIYSPHQVTLLAARLRQTGVIDPQIQGEVRAVPTHHGIAPGRWATRDCDACHGDDSAVTAEFWLADFAPGGAIPRPVAGSMLAGEISVSECGHVIFHADPAQAGFDLTGTGPDSGLGRFISVALLIVVALVAFTFGTGPMLATFRRRKESKTREGGS